MPLFLRITNDLKNALKSGSKEKAGVLRFLLAQIHNKEIEKYAAQKELKLNDEEVIDVLGKEAKKRREAIELFKKGGREDLVKKEEEELKILEEYLPRQLSEDEAKAVVDELIAQGFNDFNSLMREAMKKMKGRAEGRLVGELIKEKLK